MEKIEWSEEVANELTLIGGKRTLLNNILLRKGSWIGHILRKNCLLQDVIKGQMTKVKSVVRKITHILEYIINRQNILGAERGS